MKQSLRSLAVFFALLLVCGAVVGTSLALTENRIERAENQALREALSRLYPEGKRWEAMAPGEEAAALFVCRDEGNTPVYTVFLPLSLPREEALLAAAIKADGVILGVTALSEAGGVGLGERALEEKALSRYRDLSALTPDPEATASEQAVFDTVEHALLLVREWEGGKA